MNKDLKQTLYFLSEVERKQKTALRHFFGRRYEEKRKRLLKKVDSQVYDVLLRTDSDFEKIVNQNLNLMSNKGIKFGVDRLGSRPKSSLTLGFTGVIRNNGYLYLTAHEVDWGNLYFGVYPKKYIGSINGMGDSKARMSTQGTTLLGGKIPVRFRGRINQGFISFEMTDNYTEFGGYGHAERIVADPFKGDIKKAKKYIENRQDLRKTLEEWKADNLP
ncbi:MAG: hypothetical protein SchgKO_21460 [Schleiferiaceae bacterium]